MRAQREQQAGNEQTPWMETTVRQPVREKSEKTNKRGRSLGLIREKVQEIFFILFQTCHFSKPKRKRKSIEDLKGNFISATWFNIR